MTDHPTGSPPEASVREQQLAAATALVTILATDLPKLPELTWRIHPYGSSRPLDGQAPSELTDEDTRALVADWAEFLDGDVTEKRSHHDAFTTVFVAAEYEHVEVRVWGHVEETNKTTEATAR